MASQEQTKLVAKSLPSRLVSQLVAFQRVY